MSSDAVKASSFDLRLRPTSERPAARISRDGIGSSGTRLTRGTGAPFATRGGQLVQPGARRLVVGLALEDLAQLVAGLRFAPPLGQRERQVQPGDDVVRIDLDRPAERRDRLLPLLLLPVGDAEVVV